MPPEHKEQKEVTPDTSTSEASTSTGTNEGVVSANEESTNNEESVPLRVLTKERKRRKEEQAIRESLQKQLDEAKNKQKREEQYQAVTKGDLDSMRDQDKLEIIRTIKEDDWKRSNAKLAEFVDENLDELLKKKPHLGMAIGNSLNRYEEAWDQLKGHGYTLKGSEAENKKSFSNAQGRAPMNPSSMPKGAAVKEAVSVMNMTDEQFNEYRKQKIKRR